MSTHFCKVGKITPNLNRSSSLNAKKEKVLALFDVIDYKKPSKGFNAMS